MGSTTNGIRVRHFTVGEVPGLLWSPAVEVRRPPLVLVAHGGGQHKETPGLVARARHYVAHGFAVAAIDAPGHGERPRSERDERVRAAMREHLATGAPLTAELARDNAERAAAAVRDWRAALDAVQALDDIGPAGPVGFWGLSLGTVIGVPLVAAEPRIVAAVLGLAGHVPLAETARRITVPLEFLLQWNDELVRRESGLALFDAFASPEKTLHANPGRHVEVPAFELDSSARFFQRHLRAT